MNWHMFCLSPLSPQTLPQHIEQAIVFSAHVLTDSLTDMIHTSCSWSVHEPVSVHAILRCKEILWLRSRRANRIYPEFQSKPPEASPERSSVAWWEVLSGRLQVALPER